MLDITALHRNAWRSMYETEPPIIRKVSDKMAIIISEHGQHKITLKRLAARVQDMNTWVREG